ncbi:MAG TPA: 7-carboxy-7-deazaguanine synthase QueE [Chthoniobacterales bacterium]|nr:7-carboxy-7-deazaguanine synthase QueE [Chthoniobacterales bacterium]
MFVSEIFHSIQGEGELTGVPSVFIRSSGCNLRCSWCDTKYTSWTPEGEEMDIEEIVAKVEEYACRHVVLTGGEPMVAKGIHQLAARLKELGKHITIETAATILPEEIACDLASLSPKLSNSTPDEEVAGAWRDRHEKRRLQPQVIRDWIQNYNYQLKFVVASENDLEEIRQLLSVVGAEITPAKILLMPEGTDVETIHKRTLTLIDICKRHGYRYCDRLHIHLFGNTKGT